MEKPCRLHVSVVIVTRALQGYPQLPRAHERGPGGRSHRGAGVGLWPGWDEHPGPSGSRVPKDRHARLRTPASVTDVAAALRGGNRTDGRPRKEGTMRKLL